MLNTFNMEAQKACTVGAAWDGQSFHKPPLSPVCSMYFLNSGNL